jgi:hypothetical protein
MLPKVVPASHLCGLPSREGSRRIRNLKIAEALSKGSIGHCLNGMNCVLTKTRYVSCTVKNTGVIWRFCHQPPSSKLTPVGKEWPWCQERSVLLPCHSRLSFSCLWSKHSRLKLSMGSGRFSGKHTTDSRGSFEGTLMFHSQLYSGASWAQKRFGSCE